MGIWSWLIILVFSIVMLYPYVRIIRRTGHSGWWVLIMFVPLVNLAMLWVFAFAKWPAVDRANT
ncbi:hypothetical protein [Trinickia soli]|uniref:DUF805 domain-containing protein n=1 Tax=Trinickia soli TaxID=380675 RepID=A0A2N7VKZ5_9BURK|nr:hypothetical protein C0Z19_24075 [Trinickia soli]